MFNVRKDYVVVKLNASNKTSFFTETNYFEMPGWLLGETQGSANALIQPKHR